MDVCIEKDSKVPPGGLPEGRSEIKTLTRTMRDMHDTYKKEVECWIIRDCTVRDLVGMLRAVGAQGYMDTSELTFLRSNCFYTDEEGRVYANVDRHHSSKVRRAHSSYLYMTGQRHQL